MYFPATVGIISVLTLLAVLTPYARAADSNLGPDQTIAVLPLSAAPCVDPASRWRMGFTYTLTRAIRIRTLPDVSALTYDYFQRNAHDIGLDDFLLIEARAVALTRDQPHLQSILRIIRPHTIYPPEVVSMIASKNNAKEYTTYVAFPIKPDEKTFTLHFCTFRSPRSIVLDFSKAITKMGNFSSTAGLIER